MHPHARELNSKDVEGLGAEAMAHPKSREQVVIWSPPGVAQTTMTDKLHLEITDISTYSPIN